MRRSNVPGDDSREEALIEVAPGYNRSENLLRASIEQTVGVASS